MRQQRRVLVFAVLSLLSVPAVSRAQSAAQSTVFIEAENGFQTSLAAAILKKKVPLTVTTDEDKADYVLQAAPVDSKSESGAGKIARCMFMNCIGINGYSQVSVQLLKRDSSAVVWAYQVRKGNGGPLGVQSLSEAIAKHLKNDYVDKRK